jgi:hypothetical protein
VIISTFNPLICKFFSFPLLFFLPLSICFLTFFLSFSFLDQLFYFSLFQLNLLFPFSQYLIFFIIGQAQLDILTISRIISYVIKFKLLANIGVFICSCFFRACYALVLHIQYLINPTRNLNFRFWLKSYLLKHTRRFQAN